MLRSRLYTQWEMGRKTKSVLSLPTSFFYGLMRTPKFKTAAALGINVKPGLLVLIVPTEPFVNAMVAVLMVPTGVMKAGTAV